MQPLCQICCNPKRPLRFHTEQLAICQWCVTELSRSDTSPATIFSTLRSSATCRHRQAAEQELARLRGLRTMPPQLSSAMLNSLNTRAEGTVKRSEGIFQLLYRSMVDDTKYRERVAAAAARLREEVLATHRAEVAVHAHQQRELETKITAVEASIDRISVVVEEEIQRLIDKAKSIEPIKSKEVRLLRAYYVGLINSERTENLRPEADLYEQQKRRIRARDSNRCVCCLRGFAQGELHVHHVIPLSRCGTNADSNLVTLCHPCHNKQHPEFQVTRSFPIKRRPPTSRFVAVDIETTGLSNEDSIIEVAAVRFVAGQVEETYCSLVRSKRAIPEQVTKLTGITQAMVSKAPHPEIVVRDLVAFISDYRLVIHNASFTMRFIRRYLDYFNQSLPSRIIDTLPLARGKLPELSSHRLTTLVDHLCISVPRDRSSQADSLAIGLLYLRLREIVAPRAKKPRIKSIAARSKQSPIAT